MTKADSGARGNEPLGSSGDDEAYTVADYEKCVKQHMDNLENFMKDRYNNHISEIAELKYLLKKMTEDYQRRSRAAADDDYESGLYYLRGFRENTFEIMDKSVELLIDTRDQIQRAYSFVLAEQDE